MSKKKYISPKAIYEKFTPEQSICSCYNIACEYGIHGGESGMHAPSASEIDGVLIPGDKRVDDTHGKNSRGTGCGWAENQVVEVGPDYKVKSLKEINVHSYQTMDCDVLLQKGDTVYWTTKAGNDRLWSHMGHISYKNASHPNMS